MTPMPSTAGRKRHRLTARVAATLRSVATADARLLARSTAARTPATDRVFGAASQAADRSMLWLILAALLAAVGRRQGRHTAVDGVLAIGLASGLVNGPLKLLARRARPALAVTRSPERVLPMPASFSFPSGHTASGGKGSANSARGAARLVTDALKAARSCGGTGLVIVRADLAYYGRDVIAAINRGGARLIDHGPPRPRDPQGDRRIGVDDDPLPAGSV